jgi:hypothetical protein
VNETDRSSPVGASDEDLERAREEFQACGTGKTPPAALEPGWLERHERPQPTLHEYDSLLPPAEVIQ